DGTEDLVLGDRHRVVDAGEQSGVEEVAIGEMARPAASVGERCPVGLRGADHSLDPGSRAVTDQGAHGDGGIGRIPYRHLVEQGDYLGDYLVVDRLLHQSTGEQHATLTGEEGRVASDFERNPVRVCV